LITILDLNKILRRSNDKTAIAKTAPDTGGDEISQEWLCEDLADVL
jgi:hypothetical protein